MESTPDLPSMELGYPRTDLRRRLVKAVLDGEKTATSSLFADYERDGEPLPQVGDRFLLRDYDDNPVAVVLTTEVRVLRVADVEVAFAHDEGESFTSVHEWRIAHEAFWNDHTLDDDTLVVAERFRIVERL